MDYETERKRFMAAMEGMADLKWLENTQQFASVVTQKLWDSWQIMVAQLHQQEDPDAVYWHFEGSEEDNLETLHNDVQVVLSAGTLKGLLDGNSRPSASVPEGWIIERESHDRITIDAEGLGFYVARINATRISEIMLYALANDLLNGSTTPQPAPCQTCIGHGMIGGPTYAQPDEGGEPCPDCNNPPTRGPAYVSREAWRKEAMQVVGVMGDSEEKMTAVYRMHDALASGVLPAPPPKESKGAL